MGSMSPESMNEEEHVQLRLAFEWTCPDCGEDRFVRAVAFEGSEEDMNTLEDALEVADLGEGSWSWIPGNVTCHQCGKTFKADSPE